jgi:hypothetical protein
MKRRMVELATLIRIANLVIAALIVSACFTMKEGNPYLDQQSLLLGLVLCLQTHVALGVKRLRRDPFALLLAFGITLYYSLRIYTVSVLPASAVFDRFTYEPEDSAAALVFMLIANTLMYAGFCIVRTPEPAHIDAGTRRAVSPLGVLGLMALTIAVTYFASGYFGSAGTPRAIGTLAVLLSPLMIVTMGLTYFLLFRHSLKRSFAVALIALIVLEMVAHTLWGSRSAIVGFVQIYLLVTFAVVGRVEFSRKLVALGTLLLPVAAVLMVGAFAISTFNRAAKESGSTLDVGRSISLASEAREKYLTDEALETFLGAVMARAGFFDFSAELMANRDLYSPVVNVGAYSRSIIDNVLTPGFDLYDQPKIANSIAFVYRGWGEPSKKITADATVYQSDQLGMYGDYFLLFGYASLPLFFLTAVLLKWAYAHAFSRNPFLFAMTRVIVLSIFVRTLDSFGIDWTIGEVAPLVVATILYSVLFASRNSLHVPQAAAIN